MKNYTITVNGNVYDVVVEEKTAGSAPAKTSAVTEKVVTEKKAAPVAEPVVVEEKKTEEKAPEGTAGSIRIEAGAAGKVYKLEVKTGQKVKAGDPIIILEAMKMEIPIVSPSAGKVASVDVSVGDAVEAGATLATLF